MTMSTVPSRTLATTSFCSAARAEAREQLDLDRETPAKRRGKVRKCCSARIVVGTSTATCLPSRTALKAARIATSVLP